MSRAVKALALAGLIVFAVGNHHFETVTAAEIEAEVTMPVKITGYCLKGKTASGEETRPGICAYRPKDIGKTAIVYDSEKNLIGIYEVKDTGKQSIKDGYVLDIWCETEAECWEMTGEGYVQIVEAEG